MDNFFVNLDFFEDREIKQFYEAKAKGKLMGMTVTTDGKKYKVFVRELFAILTTKNIPSEHGNKTLDGFHFIKDYAKGFDNGMNYFNTEFSVTANTLYNNPEIFVNNLHLNYYHRCPDEKNGWINWIETYPLIISQKEIEKYGYYAGVKFALDQLIDKHPVVFKNFDVCPEKENKTSLKITAPTFALFCSIVHQSGLIEKGFDESAESYCKKVFTYFKIDAKPNKVRQYFNEVMTIKRTDKKLKKVTELILPTIPGEAKQKIETYINNKINLYA